MKEAGKLAKAIQLFQQAIKLNDKNETIFINLGKALVKALDLTEAENAFKHSLKLNPEHPEPYFFLGEIYHEDNKLLKAKEYFSKALELDAQKYLEKPDEFTLAAKFFLTSIEQPEIFNEDKKTIVANLFDSYADKFDEHLVKGLQYKTPGLINELIVKHVKNNNNNSLDLGCGTGLCGKHLKKISKSVIGVDLSAKMIDKAKLLECYDQLIVGEITEVVK